MGADTAAGTARAAATKAVPQAAIRAVADTLRDAGTDLGNPEATGGEVSFLRARMAKEVLKAQTAKVRLEKMKAEVIDRARATAMVFDLARRERDAWLNWSPRMASFSASTHKSAPRRVRDAPSENLGAVPIHDGDQIKETALQGSVRDVGAPDLTRPVHQQPPQQV